MVGEADMERIGSDAGAGSGAMATQSAMAMAMCQFNRFWKQSIDSRRGRTGVACIYSGDREQHVVTGHAFGNVSVYMLSVRCRQQRDRL